MIQGAHGAPFFVALFLKTAGARRPRDSRRDAGATLKTPALRELFHDDNPCLQTYSSQAFR